MIKSLVVATGLLASTAFGKVKATQCDDVFSKNHKELTESTYMLMGQQALPKSSGILFIYGNATGVFLIGFIDPSIFPAEGLKTVLGSPNVISSGRCMMKDKEIVWALEYNQVKSAEEGFDKPKDGTSI